MLSLELKVFLWKFLWGRLPISLCLSNVIQYYVDQYCVGNDEVDSAEHILFSCSFARSIGNCFKQSRASISLIWQSGLIEIGEGKGNNRVDQLLFSIALIIGTSL